MLLLLASVAACLGFIWQSIQLEPASIPPAQVPPAEVPLAHVEPVVAPADPERDSATAVAARRMALVRAPGQATEFPANRVRIARSSDGAPRPYYDQNRVVLRRLDVVATGGGMQISGEAYVDFDCDSAPADLKLPVGPIMGLKLQATLYTAGKRLSRVNGQVELPRFEQFKTGNALQVQAVEFSTTQLSDGFALARFQFPVLARPLAPGIYNLVVSLNFGEQDARQLQAIQWCSGFWGAEDSDENLPKPARPVLQDSQLRSRYLREVVDVLRTVESTATIYLGETLVETSSVAPTQPNVVVWDPFLQAIANVETLANQVAQFDADQAKFEANEELNEKRIEAARAKNSNPTRKDIIDESRKLTAASKKRVEELINMAGGKATEEESALCSLAVTAGAKVLDQIMQFQDYLTQRYWVLADGYLPYAGWHAVNKPGYNAYDAVANNNKKDADDRNAKVDAIRAEPGGWQEKRRLRSEQWKYYPKEITDVAFSYIDRSLEEADFDSNNFTKKSGSDIVLDIGKWADYRAKWMAKFLKDTDLIFNEVDTSVLYANQLWPEVLAQAKAARDDVISNAFAWEFQIRTATGKVKEDAKTVVAEWTAEDQANPALGLQKYIIISQVAPGSVKQRFDGRLSYIKRAIKLRDFIPLYRQAIDAKAPVLPGTKPVAR